MSSYDNGSDGKTRRQTAAANVSRLADEAAVRWLARLESSDVTDEEHAQFALWLAQDEEHKTAFDNIALIWDGLGEVLKEHNDHLELRFGEEFDSAVAMDEELMAESNRPTDSPIDPRMERRRSLGIGGMGIAAAAVFAVATTTALLVSHNWSHAIETQVGQVARHVLDDGSIVHLNTNSVIRVHMNASRRRIELVRGEAYFEVAQNQQQPFTVKTRFGSATATGTAFSVRELPESGMWVTVTEGKVEVSPATSPESLRLFPGERAVVNDQVASTPIDTSAATAWRHRKLVYDGVRIDGLIRDLNRYMPVKMSVVDDGLAAVEVSAILKLDDQAVMLDALAATFDLRWKRVTAELILIRENG